jgi:hypothetical protein
MNITDMENCKEALSKYTYINLENTFPFPSLFQTEIKSNDIIRKFQMKWAYYNLFSETVRDINQTVSVLPYDQNWELST